MVATIAWRNIWRNRVRSFVVIAAIAVGLWAGMFASAFVQGMMDQRIDKIIRLEITHFQVHQPGFRDEFLPEFTIQRSEEVIRNIQAEKSVSGVSARVISMLMINSANDGGSIKVSGILPEDESSVTDLHRYLVKGKYFEGIKSNPILISRKIAEKLKVGVRSKIVLTLMDVEGAITAGAFRVVGIFDTKNPMYDEANAFVRRDDLQKLLGIGDQIHEIAVLLKNHDVADSVASHIQLASPDLEVLSWLDLAPGMRIMVETQRVYTYVIVGIILFALLFSIINTMLMAVLERTREIGIMMAIGMIKTRVFLMIMTETIFLAMIGGPLGLLLSWASISYFGVAGLDLSGAAYGDMGFASIIYPKLDANTYIIITGMVLIMAILAAIYPARKALSLIPIEAIRKLG